ncbi:MAG: hypothetical protein KIS30_02090 [Thermoplasmata archaeon]|nr:hypothetical protein [Candidatus Sysuiplasma acidicola]MBX8645536.1 hypothetical protein [Candidatus Sysuiplasma acidicola]
MSVRFPTISVPFEGVQNEARITRRLMRNGLRAIDGWSAVRKHVASLSPNVFAYLMVQTASNLLKYAAIYV